MELSWHKISEEEKEEIKNQVSKNLNLFSKKLSEIKENFNEPFILREESYRFESKLNKEDKNDLNFEFKNLILTNAPHRDKDFIIAEKKKW